MQKDIKNIKRMKLDEYIYSFFDSNEDLEENDSYVKLRAILENMHAEDIPVMDFCRHFGLTYDYITVLSFLCNLNYLNAILKFSEFYQSDFYKNLSNMSLGEYIDFMFPKVADDNEVRQIGLNKLKSDYNAYNINVTDFRLHFGLHLNIMVIVSYLADREHSEEIYDFTHQDKPNKLKVTI